MFFVYNPKINTVFDGPTTLLLAKSLVVVVVVGVVVVVIVVAAVAVAVAVAVVFYFCCSWFCSSC